jgi:DNA-directed RNA polymerase subunit M/transcription elongation factor TFIIS
MSSPWNLQNNYPLRVEWFSIYKNRSRLNTLSALGACITNLLEFKSWKKEAVYKLITDLEQGCVNAAIDWDTTTHNNWNNSKFVAIYDTFSLQLTRNLDPYSSTGKNQYLIDRIIDGTFPPDQVAKLSPEELNPDAVSEIKKQINESDRLKDAMKVLKSTKLHTCSKCGNNETLYDERQIRSGDEGASVFYTCTRCNHVDFEL